MDNVPVDVSRDSIIRHGTSSGYGYHKCRCDECKAYKAADSRAHYLANCEKRKEQARRWAEDNREAKAETARKYRERNADQIRASRLAYMAAHRAEAVERTRKWREANHERAKELNREYVERNRAEHNRRGRDWHRDNHERSRETSRAYWRTDAGKAARRAANYKRREGRLRNVDEVAREYLLAIAADPCAYCGGFADTVDHMTPLSRGGSNEWWNFTAACRSCNSRKHDKTRPEFLLELSASPPTPGLAETA